MAMGATNTPARMPMRLERRVEGGGFGIVAAAAGLDWSRLGIWRFWVWVWGVEDGAVEDGAGAVAGVLASAAGVLASAAGASCGVRRREGYCTVAGVRGWVPASTWG